MQITTILFDMDETLCPTYEVSEKAAFSVFSHLPSSTEISKQYLSGIYNRPASTSGMTEFDYRVSVITKALKNHGLPVTSDEATLLQDSFDRTRMETLHYFDGVKEMLLLARKEGFKLGVITNGSGFSQHPKVDALELRELVDFVIVGGDEPEQKPSPSIFQKALNLAGCKPSEAIMVGDSTAADIDGAFNMGIRSILVKAEDKEHRRSKSLISHPKATYTTKSSRFTLELVKLENECFAKE